MQNNDEAPLTTLDAARRLGLSAERVRQLSRAGILPAVRTPRGQRIYAGRDVETLRLQRERARGRQRST